MKSMFHLSRKRGGTKGNRDEREAIKRGQSQAGEEHATDPVQPARIEVVQEGILSLLQEEESGPGAGFRLHCWPRKAA